MPPPPPPLHKCCSSPSLPKLQRPAESRHKPICTCLITSFFPLFPSSSSVLWRLISFLACRRATEQAVEPGCGSPGEPTPHPSSSSAWRALRCRRQPGRRRRTGAAAAVGRASLAPSSPSSTPTRRPRPGRCCPRRTSRRPGRWCARSASRWRRTTVATWPGSAATPTPPRSPSGRSWAGGGASRPSPTRYVNLKPR
jgi:hypothetical protein